MQRCISASSPSGQPSSSQSPIHPRFPSKTQLHPPTRRGPHDNCRFYSSVEQICLPDKIHHSTYFWTAAIYDKNGLSVRDLHGDINKWAHTYWLDIHKEHDEDLIHFECSLHSLLTVDSATIFPNLRCTTRLSPSQNTVDIIKRDYSYAFSMQFDGETTVQLVERTSIFFLLPDYGRNLCVCSRGAWSIPNDKFCEQGHAERYREYDYSFNYKYKWHRK
ncbi:hypothetical protein BDV96DRAFT_601332 [Lophiotrema nucula]|uniref:Uncharacterized protein n=1 Tax=Lophiotrema nucula TaxID=690887 RepID=A0A6A5Z622_9PLEO|nr:hypothetical protein BDV96DRAFT_601332 [Lophiotrema nucula]